MFGSVVGDYKMNVYDFDNTIYDGDSTLDFYFYELWKHPAILRVLPQQVSGIIRYKLHKIDKTQFKEIFFSFLQEIEDIDTDLSEFWDLKQCKIKQWYINGQNMDDVIISASPEFLLEEICKRIGINYLIASKVNKKTGEFIGLNCHDIEKKSRFEEMFGHTQIQKFYSDSYSDSPLADIAFEAYYVKKNKILKWTKDIRKSKM